VDVLNQLPHVTAAREHARSRRWPTFEGPVGRRMRVDGRDVLMFGSNDYLGLGADPAITAGARNAIDRYGSGHGINPVLGVTSVHRELMDEMRAFTGCEDVLLFNSCTAANCALVPTLVIEGDVVVSDELNHASIIDACRLARGSRKVYRHGDSASLASALDEAKAARTKLIITDGVFSMEGEPAPLPNILRLAERTGSLVAVDESHAAGAVGATGRGTLELFGLPGAAVIQTGTFSKAFGAGIGGYVAGPRTVIELLRDQARFFIFTSGMPVGAAGAALAALRIITAGNERVARLRSNAERLRSQLRALGHRILGDGPIVPVVIGESEPTRALAARLLERAIYVPAMAFPIVPEGTARLRVQVSASHTDADLDELIDALRPSAG
jgi:glycine C-acetyltransferase